jgi:hypothetical protein
MNDTTPEIAQRFRTMIMARPGEERMVMGASMYDAARAIVRASMPKSLSAGELKFKMFERISGAKIHESIKVVRDGPES